MYTIKIKDKLVSYIICVPTYGRANPAILEMLKKDENLNVTFVVRPNQMEQGLYNHLFTHPQIQFFVVSDKVEDLGMTRDEIMAQSDKENIDYVLMLDDGLTDIIHQDYPNMSISKIIELSICRMVTDPHSERIIAHNFHRANIKFYGQEEGDIYFVGSMQQAYIINVKLAEQKGIRFKSLKEVGFEDTAFMLDSIKEGLVLIGNTRVLIEGKRANVPAIGGSHTTIDLKALEQRYDKQHITLLDYIGPMYGIGVVKKYRSNVGCLLTYIFTDFNFFREALVTRIEEHKDIVAKRFRIEGR